VSATVTLREEFDTAGITAAELVEFGTRAIALGLAGYAVRVATAGRTDSQSTTLISDPLALRTIRALEVTGPAPDLR
jgi:hypothetical protein